MKGGTSVILHNMCPGLDKMYSEIYTYEGVCPVHDVVEYLSRSCTQWLLPHGREAFFHMDHDSTAKLELIQVIKYFYIVETVVGGTKVGRDWKVVKSEYVG